MNEETRVKHIDNVVNDITNIFGNIEIFWKDNLVQMNVYKIPLEYLIYNKYNGRILSRTKSLEKQNRKLNAEDDNDKVLIEELLEKSTDRNENTLKSLKKHGQEKIGIITKDGIIIDGNRRAMLLNKIDNISYFKAVVLPIKGKDDPLEIERLETSYQMGEDEKVGYNAIEKYLKTKELISKLLPICTEDEAIKKISTWMNETESRIRDLRDTMKLMDEYLEYFDYDGMYTQLDKREGQFVDLKKWLNNFYGEKSGKAFDGYSDNDVDDLKNIAFEYIRAKYEGKSLRRLAEGLNDKHLFGNHNIWNSFRKKHIEFIDSILDDEIEINYEIQNISEHLNDRDSKFKNNVESFLEENLNDHYQLIKNNQYKNEPEKLVKNAKRSIESIGRNHSSLDNDIVQNEIKDLNTTINTLLMKSPLKTLEYINDLLNNISINEEEHNDKIYEEISKTNKLSFDLKKQLGG